MVKTKQYSKIAQFFSDLSEIGIYYSTKPTVIKKNRFLLLFIIVFIGLNSLQIVAQELKSTLENRLTGTNVFIRDGAVDSAFSALPAETGSGTVNAILNLPDGKTLLGGNIPSIAGIPTKDVVRLNEDGSPDLSFNTGIGSNGGITRLHLQPDGKILASGSFTSFNGVQRTNIVRLNQDGSVDTGFNVITNFSQRLLVCDVQPDGKIIICGDFTSVNGTPRNKVARLNPSGSTDTNFDYTNLSTNFVNAVRALPDGKILVGGFFSSGGQLIRINADGSADATFNAASGVGFVVDVKLLSDGKILTVDANNKVFRLNTDGSADTTFNSNNNFQSVPRLVTPQPDGKILVGGDFRAVFINNVFNFSPRIARLNSDGSFDSTFATPFNDSTDGLNAIAIQASGKILVGGMFRQIQTSPISAFARLNSDGGLDSAYLGLILKRGTIFSQYLYPDGKILVGGTFNMLNLAPRKSLGRLNIDGNVDNSFNPGAAIEGLAQVIVRQPDGKFLVGGSTSDNSNKALWRINADGSSDSSFNVTFNTVTYVSVIVLQTDGKILIGGGFNTVNGIARKGFARLNSDGSLDSFSVNLGTVGSGVNGIIVQPDGKIIISGGFFEVNGNTSAKNIARLNTDASLDTGFIPNTNGSFIRTVGLHQLNGKVFVAGTFSGSNSDSRTPLVKLNDNGTVDWSFNAGTLVGDVLSAVSLPNGKIFVGGEFNTFAESGSRRYVVRIMKNGSLDYTFDAGSITNVPNNPNTPANVVRQIAVPDESKVIIAGSFDYVAGQTRWSIAQLKLNPCVTRPSTDFDGDGKIDISVFRPTNKVWYRVNSYNNAFRAFQFGLETDKLVPADYDGDGRTDMSVYRPSTGTWYIFNSSNSSYRIEQFGLSEDVPFPADYDGDGYADLAVFRPSTGIWYLLRSTQGFAAVQFGLQNDVPVVNDYDGDCRSDIAIFRPSVGEWWYLRSSDSQIGALQFGSSSDKPVPADYTGDGRADIAFWRPADGYWYILRSEDNSYFSVPFGQTGDIPTPGDYDSDGIADTAIFRPLGGLWVVNRTTAGVLFANFGTSGDIPIPNALIH